MAKSNYKEQNIEYLKNKATQEGVHKTAQGILYEVLESGNGPKATIRSIVSVYYKGMLIDGSLFDDNTTQGSPDAIRVHVDNESAISPGSCTEKVTGETTTAVRGPPDLLTLL